MEPFQDHSGALEVLLEEVAYLEDTVSAVREAVSCLYKDATGRSPVVSL